jgi:fumarate reductase flavoprotein subunit
MAVVREANPAFEMTVPVVVIGAGGCGLSAALAVRDRGVDVLVIERDPSPMGSTAMSTGLIPAPGTDDQARAGITDSAELFVRDVIAKTKGKVDPAMVLRIAQEAPPTIAWLQGHGVPLELVDGFLYPGHSVRRMYGTPSRSGGELMGAMERAAGDAGAMILTDAAVETLIVGKDGAVAGVEVVRPDGARERIGCAAVILACCGYGGDAELVARYIPGMAEAVYHGHPGNRGDAVKWGEALGAGIADMTAYQGHGGLAAGHGIPILWPLIMEGGFQVNLDGHRFSNEATGYSEQAARVNAQPGHVAWSILDERLHQLMLGFEDYRDAVSARAVLRAETLEALAEATRLPIDALTETMEAVEAATLGQATDPFGRDFTGKPPLAAPFYAAKVTGALFHTQGGLIVDRDARVLREDGTRFANLFAGGGAARGISGDSDFGYMAGNGLMTAMVLGRLAGLRAAADVLGED